MRIAPGREQSIRIARQGSQTSLLAPSSARLFDDEDESGLKRKADFSHIYFFGSRQLYFR